MRIKRFIGGALLCIGAFAVLYTVGKDWPLGVALSLAIALAGGFLLRRKP